MYSIIKHTAFDRVFVPFPADAGNVQYFLRQVKRDAASAEEMMTANGTKTEMTSAMQDQFHVI